MERNGGRKECYQLCGEENNANLWSAQHSIHSPISNKTTGNKETKRHEKIVRGEDISHIASIKRKDYRGPLSMMREGEGSGNVRGGGINPPDEVGGWCGMTGYLGMGAVRVDV